MKLHASKVVTDEPKPKRVRKPKAAKQPQQSFEPGPKLPTVDPEIHDRCGTPDHLEKTHSALQESLKKVEPVVATPSEESTASETSEEPPKKKPRIKKAVREQYAKPNEIDALSKMILALDEKITRITPKPAPKVSVEKRNDYFKAPAALPKGSGTRRWDNHDEQISKPLKAPSREWTSHEDLFRQIFG